MPLFATLVAACINGLMTFYGAMMTAQNAITWARRTFIIALVSAYVSAVSACISSLLGFLSGLSLPSKFLMGVGMFIPSNAGAIIACLGSVWLACVIVRLKLDGLKY